MMSKHEEGFELNLQKLILVCLNKWWMLLACAVAGALVFGIVTMNFITPMYDAKVTVYVNNAGKDQKVNYITNTNLEAAQNLVSTYIQIIESDRVLEKVSDAGDLQMTATEIRRSMSARQQGKTEIFMVSIRHQDPEKAARIANAVAEVAPEEIESFVEGSSAKVIDYAKTPKSPSTPNLFKNLFIGGLLGGLLAAIYVVLMVLMDVRVKSEEELNELFEVPVLGQIPGFENSGRSKRRRHRHSEAYESDQADDKKQNAVSSDKQRGKQVSDESRALLGDKSDFFIREAYKTLRTNVSFTLTGEEISKVIVVTSSLQGEGKSITAVNLAISYAMADRKVLVIDCDMRRPKLARLLKKNAKYGLSNLIMNVDLLPEAVCHTDIDNLDVILAGNIPPNPSELLGSARMQRLLEELKKTYDYIFLDSPPVNMVTDAVVLAPKSDGVLFLVRANQSERGDVIHAVDQLEYAKAKLLGFVLNDADLEQTHYGYKKNRYKNYSYYRRYGRYGYSSSLPNVSDVDK